MDKKKIWESYRFPLILLGGIILGAILGAILGEKATVLAPIGNVFINLLFMVVVPMVFAGRGSAGRAGGAGPGGFRSDSRPRLPLCSPDLL